MSAKPMMCATPECSLHGQKRTVLGGCEECFQPLVQWVDPDAPTIDQIVCIICDVAYLQGKILPPRIIANILRKDNEMYEMWIKKLGDIDWKARLDEIPTIRSAEFFI